MLSHAHPEVADYPYVVFVDRDRRYIDCTEGVCELLGYTRRELLLKRIEDVSYEPNVVGLFAEYLKSGALEGDYVLQHKNRTPIPMHYRSFVFDDGCNAAVWEPIKDWRQPYFAALLETDRSKLPDRIAAALEVIAKSQPADLTTRRTMDNAVKRLKALAKGSWR
jgi:PAS domain-containing protein